MHLHLGTTKWKAFSQVIDTVYDALQNNLFMYLQNLRFKKFLFVKKGSLFTVHWTQSLWAYLEHNPKKYLSSIYKLYIPYKNDSYQK